MCAYIVQLQECNVYSNFILALMKRRGPPPEFQWLHKYSGSSISNRNSADCDSSTQDAADDDISKASKTSAEKVGT